VGASSLEVGLSWPSEVEVVPSWPSEAEEGVGLPFLAWVLEGLSWPSEVEVVPSWPSEVEAEEGVEVGSSPWLTPHANTDSL